MLRIIALLFYFVTKISFRQANLISDFIEQNGIVFSSSSYSSDKKNFIGVSNDAQSIIIFQLKNGNLNLTNELDLGIGNGSLRPDNFPSSKFIEYSIFYIGELSNSGRGIISKMTFNNYQKSSKSKAPIISTRNYDFILVDGNISKVFVIDYNGVILNESKIALPKNHISENIKVKTIGDEVFLNLDSEVSSETYELNPTTGQLFKRNLSEEENLR